MTDTASSENIPSGSSSSGLRVEAKPFVPTFSVLNEAAGGSLLQPSVLPPSLQVSVGSILPPPTFFPVLSGEPPPPMPAIQHPMVQVTPATYDEEGNVLYRARVSAVQNPAFQRLLAERDMRMGFRSATRRAMPVRSDPTAPPFAIFNAVKANDEAAPVTQSMLRPIPEPPPKYSTYNPFATTTIDFDEDDALSNEKKRSDQQSSDVAEALLEKVKQLEIVEQLEGNQKKLESEQKLTDLTAMSSLPQEASHQAEPILKVQPVNKFSSLLQSTVHEEEKAAPIGPKGRHYGSVTNFQPATMQYGALLPPPPPPFPTTNGPQFPVMFGNASSLTGLPLDRQTGAFDAFPATGLLPPPPPPPPPYVASTVAASTNDATQTPPSTSVTAVPTTARAAEFIPRLAAKPWTPPAASNLASSWNSGVSSNSVEAVSGLSSEASNVSAAAELPTDPIVPSTLKVNFDTFFSTSNELTDTRAVSNTSNPFSLQSLQGVRRTENAVPLQQVVWQRVFFRDSETWVPTPFIPEKDADVFLYNGVAHYSVVRPATHPKTTLHLYNYRCFTCPVNVYPGKINERAADVKLGGICGDVPALCIAHIIEMITGVKIQAVDMFGNNLGRCNLWLSDPRQVGELTAKFDRRMWMSPVYHGYAVVATNDDGREYLLWYLEGLRTYGPKSVRFPRHLVTCEKWVA